MCVPKWTYLVSAVVLIVGLFVAYQFPVVRNWVNAVFVPEQSAPEEPTDTDPNSPEEPEDPTIEPEEPEEPEPVVLSIAENYLSDNYTKFKSNALNLNEYTFAGNINLTSVYLPNVENIPAYAFRDCINLEYVRLDNLKSIDNNAFIGCPNLKSIYLTGNSLCSISSSASLFECNNTFNIYVQNGVINVYLNNNVWRDFGRVYSLPSDYTTIDYGETIEDEQLNLILTGQLTEFSSKGISNLKSYAFAGQSNLVSTELLNCTSLGNYAFYQTSNLSSLSLPNIEFFNSDYCFYESSLTNLYLPNCIKIGEHCFVGFHGTLIFDKFVSATNLAVENIPEDTTIYVFSECYSQYLEDTSWNVIQERIKIKEENTFN